jgi:hypothetical protein
MASPPLPSRDGLWVLFALGVLVFVSPLRRVWSGEGAPWYGVFLVWTVFIAATALLVTRGARGGDG